ncbi:hypothetical protein VST63_05890 [Mycolicibacterium sp. 050232]|uniref:hypothetical protein n=1 Tax=Mycolicibacterium sp. 050232 TaxID=3113982 RepID=UPI002E2B5FCF|nr:hypothetical protein [Mycolicibacterium sp. 050232]MED5811886.1 hypothetical protein [Mycolicibacterium sp. 050232]
MTDGLLDEFEDWLAESGNNNVSTVVGHTRSFLEWREPAPLASLDEATVRTYLLEWCPRHLSLPADDSWAVCDALVEFILFLGFTCKLRGGAEAGRRLARATNGLAGPMRAMMADPGNYGMAKSLFAGIEGAESMTEQELLAAMQQRIDEHNALPIEERRARTDHLVGQPTMVGLPFVYIPPTEADVMSVASAAALPAKVQALCDHLGDTGTALTAKGNLKLADGRALVDILDTGDEIDPKIGDKTFKTQSTESLRHLTYLLALAEEAGATRYVKNRLVPVKAWSRNSPIIKATKLFQIVLEAGVLSSTRRGISFYGELHQLLDEGVVHWLAGLIPAGTLTHFDDIVDLNARVVLSQFDAEEVNYYVSGDHLADDLSDIVAMLDMTGAVEWIDRTESVNPYGRRRWYGGTVSVTALGRQVLPGYVSAAGIRLRTADDLTEATLPELIEAMDSIPSEQHSQVLAAWRPSVPPSERAGLVAAMAAEAQDATSRLVGLRMLGMFDIEVSEPHMRQLLDTPAAGHAAIWLLDHGLATGDAVGSFIKPTIMVDILSQLVDHPDLLCEQFLQGHDPLRMLESFWRHRAPETAQVLDALGRHLPDRSLAKQARRAAIKHRSWMANGG